MTQEEQNLLIDDMLPRIRRSKLLARNNRDGHLLRICGVGSFGAYIFARDTDSYYSSVTVDLTDITVYLRSMSTMTEAEEDEYNALNGYERERFHLPWKRSTGSWSTASTIAVSSAGAWRRKSQAGLRMMFRAYF